MSQTTTPNGADCAHNWHDWKPGTAWCNRCQMVSARGSEGVPYVEPSGADVDPLAGIENSRTIGELLRERRWTRNYEATASKCDAELAKYPADDVARVAFEDALHVATCQFNKHFSKAYADNGLPPISTPELMHPVAVAALIARNAELEAQAVTLAKLIAGYNDEVRSLDADNLALLAAAERNLTNMDRINPPDGPYWSGSNDQEDLRAAILAMRGDAT